MVAVVEHNTRDTNIPTENGLVVLPVPLIKSALQRRNSELAALSDEERIAVIDGRNQRWRKISDINDAVIQAHAVLIDPTAQNGLVNGAKPLAGHVRIPVRHIGTHLPLCPPSLRTTPCNARPPGGVIAPGRRAFAICS